MLILTRRISVAKWELNIGTILLMHGGKKVAPENTEYIQPLGNLAWRGIIAMYQQLDKNV